MFVLSEVRRSELLTTMNFIDFTTTSLTHLLQRRIRSYQSTALSEMNSDLKVLQ